MAIKIHELNHVALHVRDLDTSIHFYGEVIGLPRLPRPDFNFPGAWFAFGNQELHLIEDKDLVPNRRRHHHFALLVEDAFAAKAEAGHDVPSDFASPPYAALAASLSRNGVSAR